MEKSTSTPTQHPPPPTSSLPAQDPPLPTPLDQPAMVDSKLPSLATDLNASPALTPEQTLPTPAAANQSQLPAQVATEPLSKGKKRPLERNLQIENSNYYKMRLLLKDLRPHVLEILQAPDFRNCKGAIEIQEKMKLMLQLYQEMIEDTTKGKKTAKTEPLTNGKTPQSTTTAETTKLQTDGVDNKVVGHSMVGGSAFGWNFVTYGGTEAVYSGMSKEEYRSSHPINQVEAKVDLKKTS